MKLAPAAAVLFRLLVMLLRVGEERWVGGREAGGRDGLVGRKLQRVPVLADNR